LYIKSSSDVVNNSGYCYFLIIFVVRPCVVFSILTRNKHSYIVGKNKCTALSCVTCGNGASIGKTSFCIDAGNPDAIFLWKDFVRGSAASDSHEKGECNGQKRDIFHKKPKKIAYLYDAFGFSVKNTVLCFDSEKVQKICAIQHKIGLF